MALTDLPARLRKVGEALDARFLGKSESIRLLLTAVVALLPSRQSAPARSSVVQPMSARASIRRDTIATEPSKDSPRA